MPYSVLDFGAVSGEKVDNTTSFQKAIDSCAAAGGGTVNVPAGDFGIDMISLRDNVELHLESGSRLLSLLKPVPEQGITCGEPSCNPKRYLIGGVKLKNAAITGNGIIDGRGYIHFWNKNDGLEHPLYGQRYWPGLHRPKGLIHFRESRDIVIRDITIIDPPCYNLWLLGCDDCNLSGIRIRADLRGPNDDGIDLDCCSNVSISGCDILCGDDGIALKSDIHELGYDKACENIVISDCRIKTTSDGIRIGYEGDGAIRRVAISNCVIYDTMIGISLMVAISPDDGRGVNIEKGPEITDISFDNLIIDAFQTFNFQYPKNPPDCPVPIRGFLDRIFFRNITATASRGSLLDGAPESPIRTIEFSGLHMTLSGEMGTDFLFRVPDPYPTWTDLPYAGLPWPFFVRHACNIVIRDSTIEWKDAKGSWQSEIVKTDDAHVSLRNVGVLNPPEDSQTRIPMFPIGDDDGIPYFLPPMGFDVEKELRKVYDFRSQIEEELKTLTIKPTKWITASFIYAQPADYRGRRMLNASVEEWKSVFRRFKAMHIETAIFQASLWKELYECFYMSSRYSAMKCFPVLERMFEAAEAENMRIYLGGYGSVSGWNESMSEKELEKELLEHRCCFAELCRIGKFSGMYFPSETAFEGKRLPEKEKRMRTLYRMFSDMVKSREPGMKVLASPAILHKPEQNEMFAEFWNNILEDCGIDILLPQDTIGNCGCLLSDMPAIWRKWKEIADVHGIELWSHIELFERRGFTFGDNLFPASPKRIAAQIALTEPFVSGYCCWEALYFASEEAGEEGIRMQQFLENGSLLEEQ